MDSRNLSARRRSRPNPAGGGCRFDVRCILGFGIYTSAGPLRQMSDSHFAKLESVSLVGTLEEHASTALLQLWSLLRRLRGNPSHTPDVLEPKKFAGHERDKGGLDYMHARY